MKFRCKNLLVTGGAGFIGSYFIKFILNKYKLVNIYNIDLLTYAGDLNNTISFSENDRYNFIHGDICDESLIKNVFRKYNIDGVINFAAESHVDNSIIRPDIFLKTNVNGVHNLLRVAFNFWMTSPYKYRKEYSNSRFHQISTDEVYGSILKGSFDEKSPYSPNSPYSASKAAADMLVRSYNKTYGMDTTTTICSNNFGPNQNFEKFIPKIVKSLVNNDYVPVYGDGLNIRDWIFVEDHCRAIDLIYNNSKSSMVYNVGAENEITNIDLIDIIFENISVYKKINKKIKFVNDRFGHDKRYSLNINKIKKHFGWKPLNDFNKNLDSYIKEIINLI